MTYLQFLLVVHVLGAVIGFGSTFAFAFFPTDADALEPGVRTTLADISYKVGTRLSDPVVFLIQPLTGVLMIFETGRNHGFFDHQWLWIAIVLYLVFLSIIIFVARPDTRHEYEATHPGLTPDPNYRPRGNPTVYGPVLGALIVIIIILMVWKPGD
jgi:uncharacterized membrane protein